MPKKQPTNISHDLQSRNSPPPPPPPRPPQLMRREGSAMSEGTTSPLSSFNHATTGPRAPNWGQFPETTMTRVDSGASSDGGQQHNHRFDSTGSFQRHSKQTNKQYQQPPVTITRHPNSKRVPQNVNNQVQQPQQHSQFTQSHKTFNDPTNQAVYDPQQAQYQQQHHQWPIHPQQHPGNNSLGNNNTQGNHPRSRHHKPRHQHHNPRGSSRQMQDLQSNAMMRQMEAFQRQQHQQQGLFDHQQQFLEQPHQQQQIETSYQNPSLYMQGFVAAMSHVQRQTAEFLASANQAPGTFTAVSGEGSAYGPPPSSSATGQGKKGSDSENGEGADVYGSTAEAPRFLPDSKENRKAVVNVEGEMVSVLDLLPNKASDMLLENPRLVGRWCKTEVPHSPYDCTYMHPAQIEMADGSKMHISAFAPGVAVEFMLSCRSQTGRWCTEPTPHESWSCRYLHPRKGTKVKVSGQKVHSGGYTSMLKELNTNQVNGKEDAAGETKTMGNDDVEETDDSKFINVEGQKRLLEEFQRNVAVDLLRKNSSRVGHLCTNTGPHSPTTCQFLHPAAVPVDDAVEVLGEECQGYVPLELLLPNNAVEYLLNHPAACGKRCRISVPHDVSLCSYVHYLPPPQIRSKLRDRQQKLMLLMNSDEHQQTAQPASGTTHEGAEHQEEGQDNYYSMQQFLFEQSQACPSCSSPFDIEQMRLRAWCASCGVEWQMSPKYGNAPRVIVGSGPSLMDRFSDYTSQTSGGSHNQANSQTVPPGIGGGYDTRSSLSHSEYANYHHTDDDRHHIAMEGSAEEHLGGAQSHYGVQQRPQQQLHQQHAPPLRFEAGVYTEDQVMQHHNNELMMYQQQ